MKKSTYDENKNSHLGTILLIILFIIFIPMGNGIKCNRQEDSCITSQEYFLIPFNSKQFKLSTISTIDFPAGGSSRYGSDDMFFVDNKSNINFETNIYEPKSFFSMWATKHIPKKFDTFQKNLDNEFTYHDLPNIGWLLSYGLVFTLCLFLLYWFAMKGLFK